MNVTIKLEILILSLSHLVNQKEIIMDQKNCEKRRTNAWIQIKNVK